MYVCLPIPNLQYSKMYVGENVLVMIKYHSMIFKSVHYSLHCMLCPTDLSYKCSVYYYPYAYLRHIAE